MTDNAKKRLIKNISVSDLFVVLGTKDYIIALKDADKDITTQIQIAREFKKPCLMFIDRNLSKEDRQYLDNCFSEHNIISKTIIDIRNRDSAKYMARQISTILQELKITDR